MNKKMYYRLRRTVRIAHRSFAGVFCFCTALFAPSLEVLAASSPPEAQVPRAERHSPLDRGDLEVTYLRLRPLLNALTTLQAQGLTMDTPGLLENVELGIPQKLSDFPPSVMTSMTVRDVDDNIVSQGSFTVTAYSDLESPTENVPTGVLRIIFELTEQSTTRSYSAQMSMDRDGVIHLWGDLTVSGNTAGTQTYSGGYNLTVGDTLDEAEFSVDPASDQGFENEAAEMGNDFSDCMGLLCPFPPAVVLVGVAVVFVAVVLCIVFCWLLWYARRPVPVSFRYA